MLKILIPIDGSENALRAVGHAIVLGRNKAEIACHLLNVQEPMDLRIRAYRAYEEVRAMEHAEARKALQPACTLLDAAGIRYETAIVEGQAGSAIAGYAQDGRYDGIVMGMRGLGFVAGPFHIGSVTSTVLQLATIPVTLVK